MGDKKKDIFIGVMALFLLGVYMGVDYIQKRQPEKISISTSSQYVSPNILSITQPVTTFSGVITKIEGNRVVIKQKNPASRTATSFNPFSTPAPIEAAYTVIISDKTQISQAATSIFLFKTVTPTPSTTKLGMSNMRVGQYVTVSTKADLRTLKEDVFEADSLTIPPNIYIFTGRIARIEGTTINIDAYVPDVKTGVFTEKFIDFYMVPQETEISHMSTGDINTVSKPLLFGYKDLYANIQATVYSDKDYTEGGTITALRVDPQINTTSATPSASLITPTP